MSRFFGTIEHFFEKLLLPRWMAPEWMSTAEQVGFYITTWLGVVFMLCYTYQFFYVFVAFVRRPRRYPDAPQDKRFAVVIAARNEERVLPSLLESIREQTYPQAFIDVYVVADNCTDQTAAVARCAGAKVFERYAKNRVGKGYALEFLFDRIGSLRGWRYYDAYLVFDADNVLRPNYIAEMNKAFAAGYRVLTSYRNSKNYGKSWISAGYALWFMRESRHLQNPRALLGGSAMISGTGFLVDSRLIEQNGGWKHFLLTEDIEFSADCIIKGERVGYCHAAELFDEQPETFAASWRQRKRWARGMFQVIRHYGWGLLRGALCLRWPCFDMAMNILPAFLLSTLQLLSITALFVIDLLVTGVFSKVLFHFLLDFLVFGYGIFWLLGALAMLSEWRHIHCRKRRAVLLLFAFPVFMLSYIPISVAALCARRVEWQAIEHKRAMTASEIEMGGIRAEKRDQ